MIQSLNIPKPGEHISIEGPYLQGIYRVYKSLITADIREYKCDAILVDFHNGPAGIDRKARNISLATGSDGWFYGTDSKPVEFHELTIVLPTAGRPVFLKLPEIPGMSTKELSGTVHWAALEGKDKYRFAVYLKRYLDLLTTLPIMIDDLVHIFWDNEKSEWYVIEFDGGHRQVGQHRVEVTFS